MHLAMMVIAGYFLFIAGQIEWQQLEVISIRTILI